MPHSTLPAAILWDLDGTLVDTEPLWIAAEIELMTSHGLTWTHEDALTLVGKSLDHSAEIFISRGVPGTPDEIIGWFVDRVNAQVAAGTPPWRPGAVELVTQAAQAGIPQAIVTMSYRVQAQVVADALPDGAITTIVAGDMVTHGKPHPEAYLTAAATLGVDIAACLAVEDSLTGTTAALASGAATVGVPHLEPLPALPGLASLPTLEGVSLEELVRVAASVVR